MSTCRQIAASILMQLLPYETDQLGGMLIMMSIQNNKSVQNHQQLFEDVEKLVKEAFYHKNKASTHGAMGCGYVCGAAFVMSTLATMGSYGVSAITNDLETGSLVGVGTLASSYVFLKGLRRVKERALLKKQIEEKERLKLEAERPKSDHSNRKQLRFRKGLGALGGYAFYHGLRRMGKQLAKQEGTSHWRSPWIWKGLGVLGGYAIYKTSQRVGKRVAEQEPIQQEGREPRSLWEIQFDQANELTKQIKELIESGEKRSFNGRQRRQLKHAQRRARDVANLYQTEINQRLNPKQKAKLAFNRIEEEGLLSSSPDEIRMKELERAIKLDEKMKQRERTYQLRCQEAGREIPKFKITRRRDEKLASKRAKYNEILAVVDEEVAKFRRTAVKGQTIFGDLHDAVAKLTGSEKEYLRT